MLQSVLPEVRDFFAEPNAMRSVLILVGCVVLAAWLSRYVAKLIIHVAQRVATRSDNESDEIKAQRYRELETYLSIDSNRSYGDRDDHGIRIVAVAESRV